MFDLIEDSDEDGVRGGATRIRPTKDLEVLRKRPAVVVKLPKLEKPAKVQVTGAYFVSYYMGEGVES